MQTWKLDTNVEGKAQQQIKAAEAGQYRLSYKLTDAKKHTIEGGYVFVVRGDGFDRHRISASTTSSWSPTSANTLRATRSSC